LRELICLNCRENRSHIVRRYFNNNELSVLPPQWPDFLRAVYLHNNAFEGRFHTPVPSTLRDLRLYNNRFTGALPTITNPLNRCLLYQENDGNCFVSVYCFSFFFSDLNFWFFKKFQRVITHVKPVTLHRPPAPDVINELY